MNRVDRLLAVMMALQSRKYTTAEQLSERFGMSIRTVFRDLKALDEIGVPIGFEPNRGYFVMQGYFLPPVLFSNEEAHALVLVESIVERFTDKSISKHYHTALTKVKAVLKSKQKDGVEQLAGTILAAPGCPGEMRFEYLSDIQSAIANQTTLRIDYENVKQETSHREIEPIGIIFYSMAWHVIGWCWLRREYRDFKVSRIVRLCHTHSPFRKPVHQELKEYIKEQELARTLT
jgi:predicted DNA-binding transcriptional regulator YafY